MKSKSGFTLVELVIVCAVVSILATIVTFSYSSIMRNSHDNARTQAVSNVLGFMNDYYQKNAGYPITCFQSLGALTCSSIATATNTDLIAPNTSSSSLRAVFPKFDGNFSDPIGDSTAPINHTLTSGGPIQPDSYFLLSTDVLKVPSALSISFSRNSGANFSCSFKTNDVNLSGVPDPSASSPRTHQLVMGYWSEVNNAWTFLEILPTADMDTVTWNTANNPLCNTTPLT